MVSHVSQSVDLVSVPSDTTRRALDGSHLCTSLHLPMYHQPTLVEMTTIAVMTVFTNTLDRVEMRSLA